MDTKVLEYIIAIADEKSITKAADKFFLSPAAISQQLKRIEESLGAHLFMRVCGEFCLTDVGKIFINGARSTLYVQNEALSKINAMRTDLTSVIRIAADSHTANLITKSALPMLKRSIPQVDVKLITADGNVVTEYLLNGLADVGIVKGLVKVSDPLEYIPLHDDELVLAMPAQNPLVPRFEAEGVSMEALSTEYFILNKDNEGFRFVQQEAMERYRFQPQVLCEVGSLKAAIHMVENGLGDALLPSSFLKSDSPAYRAFRLKPPMEIKTAVIYPKTMILNKPMKEFITILKELFKDFKYDRQ